MSLRSNTAHSIFLALLIVGLWPDYAQPFFCIDHPSVTLLACIESSQSDALKLDSHFYLLTLMPWPEVLAQTFGVKTESFPQKMWCMKCVWRWESNGPSKGTRILWNASDISEVWRSFGQWIGQLKKWQTHEEVPASMLHFWILWMYQLSWGAFGWRAGAVATT